MTASEAGLILQRNRQRVDARCKGCGRILNNVLKRRRWCSEPCRQKYHRAMIDIAEELTAKNEEQP
jgi:hypothetical protein